MLYPAVQFVLFSKWLVHIVCLNQVNDFYSMPSSLTFHWLLLRSTMCSSTQLMLLSSQVYEDLGPVTCGRVFLQDACLLKNTLQLEWPILWLQDKFNMSFVTFKHPCIPVCCSKEKSTKKIFFRIDFSCTRCVISVNPVISVDFHFLDEVFDDIKRIKPGFPLRQWPKTTYKKPVMAPYCDLITIMGFLVPSRLLTN